MNGFGLRKVSKETFSIHGCILKVHCGSLHLISGHRLKLLIAAATLNHQELVFKIIYDLQLYDFAEKRSKDIAQV